MVSPYLDSLIEGSRIQTRSNVTSCSQSSRSGVDALSLECNHILHQGKTASSYSSQASSCAACTHSHALSFLYGLLRVHEL